MIPRLLKADATDFTRLGIGALTKTIRCEISESLGSAPVLEMAVLADDPLAQNIEIGNIITAMPNRKDNIQAFVIEEITKPIDGVIEIYAPHIAQHRAKLIPVGTFSAINLDAALIALVNNSLETNPFTLVRDPGKNNVVATMAPTVPHSLRELMGGVEGSIIDTYKGEWGYDNFTLTLYNRRGRDNGARVMYGRTMTDFDLQEEFNWNNSVTGVIGYWIGENSTVIGTVQYSQYANLYPYKKTICMDFSDKFDFEPTQAQLDTYAGTWINSKGLYGSSVDIAFEHLSVDGGEDIGLGDVIHIYSGQYNISIESRIVGTVFDVLQEEFTTLTIGEQRTTLNEAISDISGGSSYAGGGGGSVEPSTSYPIMDGIATIGIDDRYARADHIHPSDTSRFDKSGDDLTGNVRVISSNIDATDPAPSAAQNGPAFQWVDDNLTTLGTFRLRRLASSNDGAVVMTTNVARNGIQNALNIGVDDNGARVVSVTSPSVWRTALEAAPLASPAFTGNPTAPTQSAGNNSTRLATTAFVRGEVYGKRVLGQQSVTLATTASTAADGTATTTGTMTAVTGATEYILLPRTCNYGIFTALSRSGNTISATLRNVSNAAHTLSAVVVVIALG